MENENKIRKVIINEATIVAAIVTFFGSLFMGYSDIATKIALLTNEVSHITKAIEDINKRNGEADLRQVEIEKQLSEISGSLGKKQ